MTGAAIPKKPPSSPINIFLSPAAAQFQTSFDFDRYRTSAQIAVMYRHINNTAVVRFSRLPVNSSGKFHDFRWELQKRSHGLYCRRRSGKLTVNMIADAAKRAP